jgi:5,10-methylenetetrahydromethanopterin reductase
LSELSIASDGRDAPPAFLGKVAVADRAGLSRIWIANHLFLRDPISLAGAALGASRDLRINLMAMSPFTIHPVQLAMAAATLDEFYPGRVGLCLGSGAPADLASVGIDSARPLGALREALRLVRALLAGETV